MRRFYILLGLLFFFYFYISILSNSYAWTFEDFLDYVQFTYDNNINSSSTTINNYRNWIVNNKQSLYTQLQNLNINVNNYNNFIIEDRLSSQRVEIYMYNGSPVYTCSSSGVNISPSISCMHFYWHIQGNNAQSDTKTTVTSTKDIFGLIDSNPTNGDYYNTKIQNVWNYYVLRNGVYTVDNLPWELADVKIANAYNQENIIFILYDINDNEVKTLSYARQNEQTLGGYLYLLYIDNTLGLVDGQTYYFKASNGSDILRSENFILNWSGGSSIIPSGTITNQSGDITGSIDLSGIENGITNLTNTVYSGDKEIVNSLNRLESGEIARDNFWRNTYDSLFSMDSGDTNDLYLMIQSYFPSGDTPLSVYDTIFGSFNNEPDDFIIRWDDHPLNITWFGGQTLYSGDFIKAGSMNFSKECRDNSTLSLIKFWLNTCMTFFIMYYYYKFLYQCLMDVLGVASEDIQEDPTHRPIGFGRG